MTKYAANIKLKTEPFRNEEQLYFLWSVSVSEREKQTATPEAIQTRMRDYYQASFPLKAIYRLTEAMQKEGHVECKDSQPAPGTWESFVLARDPGIRAGETALTSTGKRALQKAMNQNGILLEQDLPRHYAKPYRRER